MSGLAENLRQPLDVEATAYTVLIVDDEPEIRRLTRRRLESEGYRVIEAEDGHHGLAAIQRHVPDVVLCDVHMPKYPGPKLLSALRTDYPEFADIPFIFITGQRDRQHMISAIEDGADDYLTKPLDVELLLTKIRSSLKRISRMEFKRLSEMERLRTSVLRMLPHELRTPLTHILGFSEVLKEQMLGPINNENYMEYINGIHSGGEQLLSTVNKTLELVDIVCGRVQPEMVRCDVVKAVCEAIDGAENSFEKAGLTYECIFSQAPIYTNADPAFLMECLNAVLSNAIKFSEPESRVKVSVKINADGDIEIVINDMGTGIPADEISKVFDAFAQYDSGMSRKYDGMGLGLTIVKMLMNAMEGIVYLESQFGVGTTVTLVLSPALNDASSSQSN